MRAKSAAVAVCILLLIAAQGCSKNKKPEETPAATSTATNPPSAATSAAPTTATGAPSTPTGAATTQTAQNPPAAPAPEAPAKPPAVKKHVAKKGAAPSPAASPEGSAQPSEATESAVHKPPTLPGDTVLTVRLNEAVSSKTSHPGDKFTATVEEPVQVGSKVVVPKGSAVSGTVVDAKGRGKIKGGALLRLELDSMTVKEKDYDIHTSIDARTMTGKGKRTAAIGGGGAATGALVGALAGGAKGFGIGMLVGAGVGLAGGAFTGNKNIELPAETVLSFKLLKPVTLDK